MSFVAVTPSAQMALPRRLALIALALGGGLLVAPVASIAAADNPLLVVLIALGLARLTDHLAGRRWYRPSAGLWLVVGLGLTSSVEMFVRGGGSDELARLLRYDPVAVGHGELWRLLTVALVHNDVGHLVVNLVPLAILLPLCHRFLGTRELLCLVVSATIIGALMQGWVSPGPDVGASVARYALSASWPFFFLSDQASQPGDRRIALGLLGGFVVVFTALAWLGGLGHDLPAHQSGFAVGLAAGWFSATSSRQPAVA